MAVSFSANGKEVKSAYDSILSGESTYEWALYGYQDGTNEIELVDSGSGLEKLCDEFDEEEYQYAFARVIDPNSNLPRFVFISWCGESVPFTKKGMYNAFTNDVLRFFSGFHIHINARSKFDVDPEEIMKKVKNSSGANYSFHQKQTVKNNVFNKSEVEQKIELKAEDNKSSELSKFPSLQRANPLNNQSTTEATPKANPLNNTLEESKTSDIPENRRSSMTRRRSSVNYNPLQPSSSRKNSMVKRDSSIGSFQATIEKKDKNEKPPYLPSNSFNTNPVNNENSTSTSNTTTPTSAESPTRPSLSRRSSSFYNRRRSSVDYNPLQPNASRKNSFVQKETSVGNISAAFESMNTNQKEDSRVFESISNKISAFQNQIEVTNENNKREQAIQREISSRSLKSWKQKENPLQNQKEEPETAQSVPTKIEEPSKVENINENTSEKQSVQQSNSMTVKALYSYDAQEEGELSFEENEILINVVEVPGEGWWSGNNSKGQYGMFPSNYVTSYLNQTIEEEGANEEIIVQEVIEKPSVSNDDNTNNTAVALYDYEAQDDTEISFSEGEIITGIILQDENWGIGINSKNQQGMFPLNYVQIN
ncbi:hypothetical protein H8356DRAFT_991492 [Neocallimastix lanati (nom. inval.)]|jgi:hypothetical protein|uniref:Actin depolymerizing protein n=1 Tax=Neocallimastix californiae TaxID=1754190 RepID=A0A1Y2ALY9_9FUNG|nr:hypothetical protein H8356DRAFT_991492 [Neocallimastix sp. JGI-2020a]ORY23571.1 hypothetical protein LY90DRAFT_389754 [Neocallimastix californiae]|eukprot:ORY23571.1 hypothetical protein LY90DRAFT_389754 [Neocallimastix californiae]